MSKIYSLVRLLILVALVVVLVGCAISDGQESLALSYTLPASEGNLYIEITDTHSYNGTRVSHRVSGEYEIHCDFGPDSVVTLPKETMTWDGTFTYQETWRTTGICYMGQALFDEKLSLYDFVSSDTK